MEVQEFYYCSGITSPKVSENVTGAQKKKAPKLLEVQMGNS